jgi:hypothetical protein
VPADPATESRSETFRRYIDCEIGVTRTCANEHDTDATEDNANSAELVYTAAGPIDVAQADLDLVETPHRSGQRGVKAAFRMAPEGIRNRDVPCDSHVHEVSFR